MKADKIPVLEQFQTRITDKFPGENLDMVIDVATKLERPTEADLQLYFDSYYENYSRAELVAFSQILEDMLEVRRSIEADLRALGVDLHMDSVFRGIQITAELISALLMVHRDIDLKDSPGELALRHDKFEYLQKNITRIFHKEKVQKLEAALVADFSLLWDDFLQMLSGDLSQIDLAAQAASTQSRIETIFAEHKVEVVPRENDLGLRQNDYLIEDKSCRIAEQMAFIDRFLDIFASIGDYLSQIESHQPEQELLDSLESNRLKYGAKAAHLIFLQALLEQAERNQEKAKINTAQDSLQKARQMIEGITEADTADPRSVLRNISNVCDAYRDAGEKFLQFEVPPSVFIEADLYDRWERGEDVDADLKRHYEAAKLLSTDDGKPLDKRGEVFAELFNVGQEEAGMVIVRSSAVHSEDGKNHTGAGVYHSEPEVALWSFESFKEGVLAVWESTNPPEAIAYRASIGVKKESMGVIIQPQISEADHVQINSTKPHFSGHIEGLANDELPIILQKQLLIFDVAKSPDISTMYSEHMRVDWTKFGTELRVSVMSELMKIADTLERLFGEPIQLEMLHTGKAVKVVQMRPLPALEAIDVPEFPDAPYLFKGRGVGVGKKTISKDDMAIAGRSYGATVNEAGIIPSTVGRYEAVVMTNSFDTNAGHIEQQCLEKDVLLVTNDPLAPMTFPRRLPERLVIISNGFEGRVYDADDLED